MLKGYSKVKQNLHMKQRMLDSLGLEKVLVMPGYEMCSSCHLTH